jgi:LuxR family maltose regulon positive regulatory protein
VARARLHARLSAGTTGPLTLVCAAAGWGKTTLVADWLHATGRRAAWLSLDEADGEPARLVAYLVAALRDVEPTIAPGLSPESPEPPDPETVVIELVNALAELPGDVVLVLDDLHHVEAEAAHALLAFLLESAPPNLHLVVTTRVDPPWPLARLRARGQLVEVRAPDLRFSVEETQVFFEETMGLDLPRDALRQLDRRTEGWAAGLQMAALSLRGRDDPAAFIESFAGSHRFVLDYLLEEVLGKMQPARREALLRLSILRELSAPIVDALLGIDDGAALLEELDTENLFIVALDDTRTTYRFHHLFGTLLGHELVGVLGAAVRRDLHVRAAAALQRFGALDEAFHHAIEGEDWDRAERMLRVDADLMMLRRSLERTASRIDRFPEEQIARRPALLVKRVWVRSATQRRRDTEDALAAAEDALARQPDPALRAELTLFRAIDAQGRGEHAESLRLFAEAEPDLPADNPLLKSVLIMHRAFVFVAEDRFDEALEHAGPLAREAERIGDDFAVLWARWFPAEVALLRGEPRETIRIMKTLVEILRARFGDRPPQSAAKGLVTLALAHHARGEIDAAVEWLERSLEVVDPRADPGNGCAMVLAQAELEVARDPMGDGWREAIARGEQLLAGTDMRVFASRLRAHGVRHALDPRTPIDPGPVARAWLAEPGVVDRTHPVYGGSPFPTSRKDFAILLLSRAQTCVGELDAAARTADEFLARANAARRQLCMVEGRLALAEIARRRADTEALQAHVRAAVLVAAAECLAGPFLAQEPEILAAAMHAAEAAETAGHGELAVRLRSRVGAGAGTASEAVAVAAPRAAFLAAPPIAATSPIEALSERELEVLALVADGMSNAEVGRSLFVAPSTVKKHLEHVFEKLGVRRRTQAVARARSLGLV